MTTLDTGASLFLDHSYLKVVSQFGNSRIG